MNSSNRRPSNSNSDNDWGLFVDIDTNNASIYPEVTIKQLEKYKLPNKNNSSELDCCFQYVYYYFGYIYYYYKICS